MSKVLGIDLGTTNSAMAVMEGGHAKVLPTAEGGNLLPSVVAMTQEGERIVGDSAKNQAVQNPENTLFAIKRLIGRTWDDPEVQKDQKLLPFEMRKDDKNGVEVKMGDKWYKPQEISAMVLQKLKKDAEQYFGEKVTEAVVTVPAYFDDSQRQATKDAGKIAGFKVKRILNEPTAAALAYGLDKKDQEGKIAIFDLGGGTFDISILEVGEGVFEVLSTNGDTHLGGEDFDRALMDMLVAEFEKKEGIDLSEDRTALQRLKEASEKAKIELSSSPETTINIPFITADKQGPKHLMRKISRAEFEKLVAEFLDRLVEPCEKAIKDAKLTTDDLSQVILVGGMTRMPAVKEIAKKIFKKDPKQDLNPDEVVSLGAAVQAGILQGDVTDITLLDVTPLSLGLETFGGVMTKLVDRNTTIPVEKKQIFSTAADNQTAVEVHVLQGEREMASDNKTLAKFILDGIPTAPRGVPQIEVTFSIDANGILKVTAKDKATGKEQDVTITASTALSEDEVNNLVEEAKKHAEEDKKKRTRIEVRNNADSLIFTAEKTVKELEKQIKKEDKAQIEKLVEELKEMIAKDDYKEIDVKKKTEELSAALQQVGQQVYQQAAKEQQSEEKGQAAKSNEQKGSKEESEGKAKDKKDPSTSSGESKEAVDGEVVK